MSRTSCTVLVLALLAGSAADVSAQNALGDGRALDNSLSVHGRYNHERRSLSSEFAFRNAVVTGNAPGGMSFRGDVGYLAPGEFSAELGSNDLFAFQRDSLRSGMAGMGIRGTEALQYQLALTTGNQPPANLVGRYFVSRSGAPVTSTSPTHFGDITQSDGLRQRPAIDPESDDRGTMLWMLRSPSAYMSNSGLQTSALRSVRAGENAYTLTASPLRGVRMTPIPELATAPTGAYTPPVQPTEEPDERPTGADERLDRPLDAPIESRVQPTMQGQPDAQGRTASPESTRIRTMHSEIMQRLIEQDQAEKAEDVFSDSPTIVDRVSTLLAQISGVRSRGEDREDPDEPVEADPSTNLRFDPETMRMLRGDGTPVEQYIDPADAGRNLYAEQLSTGQQLMAEGRYFDAEERFAHALSLRRGDVTAQVARLHAQIGAGLFLSASLNMQSLSINRPEVFAARYGPELLPSRDRLEALVTLFQNTITEGTERYAASSPQVRQASGLLLAYIGYQMGREDLVRTGLDDFRRRVSVGLDPAAPPSFELRLSEMFRAMWLPGDRPAPSGKDDG